MLRIFFAILLNFIFLTISQGCTVWGAITPTEILIAKNRDFYPRREEFITVSNKNKYKFFGLYAHEQNNKYAIKMGVNSAGLVAFVTNASSIPFSQRNSQVELHNRMHYILENFDNVEAINEKSATLFKGGGARNYIFADRQKALLCEIGLHDDYKCELYSRKNSEKPIIFAQTNHYILPELKKYNILPFVKQQTSYLRFNKITNLLENNLSTLTLSKFIRFSFNTEAKNSNPLPRFEAGYENTYQDNSIFRTLNVHPDIRNKANPNSEQGVSAMIVQLPADKSKPITLYLRIINDITNLNDKKYTQEVQYIEATTTLDEAINNSASINYVAKSCRRDIYSHYCEEKDDLSR
ncbi:MAG: hypothetical protein K0S27_745 [Gammaproteobacteria bacterium]|jgi:hypothetical protein|nr:hypothetical protein [Gammaproteobacteria bacterium]